MNRLSCIAIGLSALCVITGCKREAHTFRVDPPQADRIQAKALVSLAPGGKPPVSTVKNEYEQNAYALSEGQRLYSAFNCVGCHAHGGGGMGPALLDAKWIYGSQPEQVFATIVEGRPNGMPAFGGHIPDFQVWELVAYVRSMSGLVSSLAAPNRPDDMKGKPPENSATKEGPKQSFLPPSAETK
jgi:cytochrome c oxidase cbb3-type subunit 3